MQILYKCVYGWLVVSKDLSMIDWIDTCCGDHYPCVCVLPSHTGYRIVGSHSGVKLCRWTKSMLRGRGGCYKHTFYGIESHRCMETTPSLACANKCVFCWRHHTNPVGTEWKWQMDEPEMIVKQALENHYQMIKQFRGAVNATTTVST